MDDKQEMPEKYKDLFFMIKQQLKEHPENQSSPEAFDIILNRVCEVMNYNRPEL